MNEVVVLETNMGVIELELYSDKAPVTVENFLSYVNTGHYNGTIFHRVIGNFMIQGGGFLPNGEQKETQKPIKLESDNGLSNVIGTIAMARTNIPDSATCQFFINVADNTFLNRGVGTGKEGYAVFGKVIKGMEAVNAIKAVETANRGFHQDWPVNDVMIEKAYIKA